MIEMIECSFQATCSEIVKSNEHKYRVGLQFLIIIQKLFSTWLLI